MWVRQEEYFLEVVCFVCISVSFFKDTSILTLLYQSRDACVPSVCEGIFSKFTCCPDVLCVNGFEPCLPVVSIGFLKSCCVPVSCHVVCHSFLMPNWGVSSPIFFSAFACCLMSKGLEVTVPPVFGEGSDS